MSLGYLGEKAFLLCFSFLFLLGETMFKKFLFGITFLCAMSIGFVECLGNQQDDITESQRENMISVLGDRYIQLSNEFFDQYDDYDRHNETILYLSKNSSADLVGLLITESIQFDSLSETSS